MLIKATRLHPGPPQSDTVDLVAVDIDAEVVVEGMVVDLVEGGVLVGNAVAITELIT